MPSVYAAGIAQRTRRIHIGYAVAVVPLHHPLRLAEEISWVDHLSEGRVAVGVGPGFSPFEFGGFGVPVDERHARFREGFDVVRRALAEPEIMFQGKRLAVHPRPYTRPHPPFYWCFGSVATVTRHFDELRAHGLRKVIGWFHFGNMPYKTVRRSMQLMANDVIPKCSSRPQKPVARSSPRPGL